MKREDLLKEIDSQEVNESNKQWEEAKKLYAYEIVEILDNGTDITPENIQRLLLNGAENWSEYSHNGCSLIYDEDIVNRIVPKDEITNIDNGDGTYEYQGDGNWLDEQAACLWDAFKLCLRLVIKDFDKKTGRDGFSLYTRKYGDILL